MKKHLFSYAQNPRGPRIFPRCKYISLPKFQSLTYINKCDFPERERSKTELNIHNFPANPLLIRSPHKASKSRDRDGGVMI